MTYYTVYTYKVVTKHHDICTYVRRCIACTMQVYTYICTYKITLSTVVLNSRDWPEKNSAQNFGVSKTHLAVGFTWKNRLKCIGMSIITPYLC